MSNTTSTAAITTVATTYVSTLETVVTFPEWVTASTFMSKGPNLPGQTYVGHIRRADDGTLVYSRNCRYGTVCGFKDAHRLRFTLRSKGKTIGSLLLYPTGTIRTHLRGKFYGGLAAVRQFTTAATKLFPTGECLQEKQWDAVSNSLTGELSMIIHTWAAEWLQVWQKPKFFASNPNTRYLEQGKVLEHLLFPALMEARTEYGLPTSKDSWYKAARGETSIKNVAKYVFGVKSARAQEALTKTVRQGACGVEAVTIARRLGFDSQWLVENHITVANTARDISYASMKRIISILGIERVKQLLLDEKKWQFADVVSMLDRVGDDLAPYIQAERWRGGLERFHDRLSRVTSRFQEQDWYLPQHPTFSKKDGEVLPGTDYTVVFPKTNQVLKDWGSLLILCIGTYGEAILRGSSVCFGLYLNGEPHICVEIAPGKAGEWKVIQIMAYHNCPRMDLKDKVVKLFELQKSHPQPRNHKKEYVPDEDAMETNWQALWADSAHYVDVIVPRERDEQMRALGLRGQAAAAMPRIHMGDADGDPAPF